ncbi:HET-domain-containing protein [Venturia nashicola]|uniref:HET-domain-containing protein n=1 Tax=Venturia nashicola TaxID=86259 RepID=A0A4Z1NG04_9PEZI|nr:HET-domain-containing protein [Venturia nashicola]
MRLIHVRTVGMREFSENAVPPYAILSHTWDDAEVSFQDMVSGLAPGKPGYLKIEYSCEQALKDGLDFVWADTACIDKTSSAELSEAINSMYTWYAKAEVCYAYLSDLEAELHDVPWQERLGDSRWFSRGWTLQELIAPQELIFYAKDWVVLGSKAEFCAELARITKIDQGTLSDPSKTALQQLSIATRMSWASKRTTTRAEDIAYCLLGIFNVNMPLLYGEGEKAFIRLQEEIMKESDDHSLFTWWYPAHDSAHDGDLSRWKHTDILAKSPTMFASSGDIVTFQEPHPKHHTMTNRGLLIDLRSREETTTYAVFATAILNCHRRGDFNHFFALELIKRGYQKGESTQWSRLHNPRGGPLFVARTERTEFKNTSIYVKLVKTSAPPSGMARPSARSGGLLLSQIEDFTVVKVETAQIWDQNTQSVQVYRQPRTRPTTIFFQHITGYGINSPIGPGQIVVVTFVLGFDQNLRPLNEGSKILGSFPTLEVAEQELERNIFSSGSDEVASSAKSFRDNLLLATAATDATNLRIWYRAANPTYREEVLRELIEYQIRLEIKEEDVMGQQMWVAELQSTRIYAPNVEGAAEASYSMMGIEEEEALFGQSEARIYNFPGWNEELKVQFDGDEAKIKEYASQKGVRLELARREKKFTKKLEFSVLEALEENFAGVPQYSYATGIRDYDEATFDKQQEGSAMDETVEDRVSKSASTSLPGGWDATVEIEEEATSEDGSWIAKTLGWMGYFF